MDDNLDDLLSEPSVVKTPSRAKFQPKAKPRPNKGPTVAVPSVVVTTSNEHPATTLVDFELKQFIQPNSCTDKKLDAPGSSSFTGSAEPKQTSFFKEECNSENTVIDGNLSAETMEVVGSAITGHLETSKSSEVGHSSANPSSGRTFVEDNIGQLTTANWPAETQSMDASGTQIEEQMSVLPDIGLASVSPFRPCSAQTGHTLSIPFIDRDSEHHMVTLDGNAGDCRIDMEQGLDEFSSHEAVDVTSEADAVPGKRAMKLQPKPNAQSSKMRQSVHASNAPIAPYENQHTKEGDSKCASEPDTIYNLSHLGIDGDFSMETTSAQPDTAVPEDINSWMDPNLPEESRKHGEGKMSGARDGPEPSSIEENENEYIFFDSANDEIQYNSSSPTKAPESDEPTINKNESNEEGYIGEETSKKKKNQQKQKKDAPRNDKTGRKRKKESKAPDDTTEKPPKKFPHATCRKRSVNKSLLEAPEDEIDLQRVPIRDLIILAEYKERQAKKEAALGRPPPMNERTDNAFPEDQPYDDHETFGSDDDTGSMDNPSITRVQKDASYFNYHTLMRREKPLRWSKQDTELFYQGVKQFGSDMSLIAQLFTDRNRDHIKLKFKKEERQHPMRLNDALNSRAKDHSHFELVIQKLEQKRAAEELAKKEQKKSDEDDSTYPSGEEEWRDEAGHETHETTAKSEQSEDGLGVDQDPDRAQVGSPTKSYDSEDDFDWSTAYRSEL